MFSRFPIKLDTMQHKCTYSRGSCSNVLCNSKRRQSSFLYPASSPRYLFSCCTKKKRMRLCVYIVIKIVDRSTPANFPPTFDLNKIVSVVLVRTSHPHRHAASAVFSSLYLRPKIRAIYA